MSDDRSQLLDMGFSLPKVTQALKSSKNSGLQPALEWLIAHVDDPDPTPDDDEIEDAEIVDVPSASASGAEAKSLRCIVCGKIFKNHALASYHGEKSGHDQFEESTEEVKPLTEEEKVQKLAELKERMQSKKAILAKKEAEEQKANEAIRRKGGKDAAQIKIDLELKEANKEALERKKDKILEAKAKAAVRLQIEADKKARAEKSAREKALRDGTPLIPSASSSTPTPAASGTIAPGEKKVYDQTRLQIRLASGGQPLVNSFASKDKLGDVVKWVKEKTGQELEAGGFSSAFPRKTYSSSDEGKTLEELGLCPSAVLMVSN